MARDWIGRGLVVVFGRTSRSPTGPDFVLLRFVSVLCESRMYLILLDVASHVGVGIANRDLVFDGPLCALSSHT